MLRCGPSSTAASTPAGRSTRPQFTTYANTERDSRRRSVGIFIAGFSSILTGLNFIVTIHKMRAPGLTWFQAAALRLGPLRHEPDPGARRRRSGDHAAAVAHGARRSASASSTRLGGDPVLFQHLFWFYSHPAVYIMILPAMGVISELIACLLPEAGLRLQVHRLLLVGIAILGFLVWGHHMFVSGQSVYAGLVFSILTMLVASRRRSRSSTGRDLYKGSISLETPMLYALGFIGLFTIGGLTGLFLAHAGHRRPRPRHLLRRGPLPLHHGGRRWSWPTWADSTSGGRR